MNWLKRLFNHDKIAELNRTIDIYKERNSQLESEARIMKDYKLKYDVMKMYVDDDEALCELLDSAKKVDRYLGELQGGIVGRQFASHQQLFGNLGSSAAGFLGGNSAADREAMVRRK